MSTHNICFCEEIRKYQYFSVEKSALSGAMLKYSDTFILYCLVLNFEQVYFTTS